HAGGCWGGVGPRCASVRSVTGWSVGPVRYAHRRNLGKARLTSSDVRVRLVGGPRIGWPRPPIPAGRHRTEGLRPAPVIDGTASLAARLPAGVGLRPRTGPDRGGLRPARTGPRTLAGRLLRRARWGRGRRPRGADLGAAGQCAHRGALGREP